MKETVPRQAANDLIMAAASFKRCLDHADQPVNRFSDKDASALAIDLVVATQLFSDAAETVSDMMDEKLTAVLKQAISDDPAS